MPKHIIKSTVENLNDVPEAYRDRYTETDGKFHLSEIEIDDGVELKNALDRERQERKTAKAALERYKGLDPDQARAALKLVQDAEEKSLHGEGRFEQLRKRYQEQQAKELAERDGKIAAQEKALRKFTLDDKVRAAALKAGVLSESLDDVMVVTAKHFELDEAGDIIVLDRDGHPTYSSVEDFFGQTYKALRPKYYGATGAGGSGAPAGGSGGGHGTKKQINRAAFDRMSQGQRMAFFQSGGQVKD